jgi:hypothetical protein
LSRAQKILLEKINAYLRHSGFKEIRSTDNVFLFRHHQQLVRLTLDDATGHLVFSAAVNPDNEPMPPADPQTIAALNAELLFDGGCCLTVDGEQQEVRVNRSKSLSDLRPEALNRELVGFAAAARKVSTSLAEKMRTGIDGD